MKLKVKTGKEVSTYILNVHIKNLSFKTQSRVESK